jgi:hypothetical protein
MQYSPFFLFFSPCFYFYAEISCIGASLFIVKILVYFIKAYDGVSVDLHSFLIVVPDGREQSSSRSRHFTPGGISVDTH